MKAFLIVQLDVDERRKDFVNSLNETLVGLEVSKSVTTVMADEAERFEEHMEFFLLGGLKTSCGCNYDHPDEPICGCGCHRPDWA